MAPIRVTPESSYLRRRSLLAAMGLGAGALVGGAGLLRLARAEEGPSAPAVAAGNEKFFDGLQIVRNPAYTVPERPITPERLATSYNNFYEFTTDKERVKDLVGSFKAAPWTISVSGEVAKPLELDVEKLIRALGVEERVYRFRCVEAWSMTVPWVGIPLRRVIDYLQPKAEARYLRVLSFLRPEQAPGQKAQHWYKWPYYEAYDIAEATHDLALLVTGIYGKPLPRQNGAPVRIIMPWKYGLKCAKSIVKMELTRERPATFWNDLAPDEYSYHSNVEPNVPHPRWSQASERLLDTGERIKTLEYNGYAAEVAGLYAQKK